MSNQTKKQLISDEEIEWDQVELNGEPMFQSMSPWKVRDKYEAHLAEQDALIQLLVDSMVSANGPRVISGLSIAKFAGFTPTTEP